MKTLRKAIQNIKWWLLGWMLFAIAWFDHFVYGKDEDDE